jgi:hypothetical protein
MILLRGGIVIGFLHSKPSKRTEFKASRSVKQKTLEPGLFLDCVTDKSQETFERRDPYLRNSPATRENSSVFYKKSLRQDSLLPEIKGRAAIRRRNSRHRG